MRVYEYTNIGSREENQDYVVHGFLANDASIYVIADGMGGYAEGATASKVVADAILNFSQLNWRQSSPHELLKEAMAFANDSLMIKRVSMAVRKMGCVVAVLLLACEYAYLTWLGDSRIYLFREGKEVYRTEDHSVINELVKDKVLDASIMEKYSSLVTKSIMGNTPMDVAPISRVKVESGDVFILCTDGFYKEMDILVAYNYNDGKKQSLDEMSETISDNYSFIKVEV